jgi:cell division protein FtsQ
MIAEGWLGRLQRLGPRRLGPRRLGPRRLGTRPRPGEAATRGARTAARTRRRAIRRPRPRTVLIVVALVVLLGGAWLWLRDSSLVSVHRVTVTGANGPDAPQIRSALVAAGRNMTTLDVHMDQLRTAVAPYPIVKDVRVSTQFPHGLKIRVIEQIPVGAISVGGRTIAVAGDGTLLHDVVPSASLPMIPLRVAPGGPRLSDPAARAAVEVLGAAPYQLLARVSQVTTVAPHGLVAELRSGPSIYFGDATRLAAKWVAATAVLADSGSAGALYIDVTDPERPAAGAHQGSASATGGSASGAGSSTAASAGGSSTTATTPTSATGQ